jgi:hypothetical protein
MNFSKGGGGVGGLIILYVYFVQNRIVTPYHTTYAHVIVECVLFFSLYNFVLCIIKIFVYLF